MSEQPENPIDLIFANGVMAEAVRNFNWSASMLGPVKHWPSPLLVTVNQILDSSFPMFIWWGQDKIQFYNDAYLQILGTDANSKHPKALGQKGEECWPEIWPVISPLLEGVIESGTPVYLEDQLIPIYRQGKLDNVYWTFSYNVIRETNGAPAGILVVCSETTQKVKFQQEVAAVNEELGASNEELMVTNEELSESRDHLEKRVRQRTAELEDERRRLATIISNVPAGLAILSGRSLALEMANTYMLDLWQKNENAIGKTLLEFLPELKQQEFPRILDDVFTTAVPYSSKGAPVDLLRNGEIERVFMNFSYTPLVTEEGLTASILVLAEDVTEQTLAMQREQQLTEELSAANEEMVSTLEELATTQQYLEANIAQLRFTLDAIPQQVWTATPDGLLNYVNKNISADFGRTGEEVVGDGWQAYIHADDLSGTLAAWQQALLTGNDYQIEFRLKFKDGKYYWHLARALPLIEDGKVKLWLGTNTNIDFHKNNEQKKDEFLSIASHELKTPLTSIKAFNQLLSRSTDLSKQQNFIEKSAQHIGRLERLINDLLDVTKINAGKMNYDFKPFDFDQLLAESIETVQLSSANHQIDLVSSTNTTYTGDRMRLEQVMNNFLSNAVKYSPDGQKVIVKSDIQADSIIVSVQDFGIGIAEESLDKLFDRYYRVDNTAMRFEGLGLGLFISSEILKRHSGTFWIESMQGNGSTFYFRLPLNVSPANAEFIKINYNVEKDWLEVDWIGFQTYDSVQKGCEIILESLKKHQVKKIINDNRHVLGTWSEAAEWVGKTWFPMAEQAGLQFLAWIFSASVFSQLSARKTVDVMEGQVVTRFYTEQAEAEEWLNSV